MGNDKGARRESLSSAGDVDVASERGSKLRFRLLGLSPIGLLLQRLY